MGAIAFGLLVAWFKSNAVQWPQGPEEVERQQELRFE